MLVLNTLSFVTVEPAGVNFTQSVLNVPEDAGVVEVCVALHLPPGIEDLSTTLTVPVVAIDGPYAGS